MSLSERLTAAKNRHTGLPCSISVLFSSLSDEDSVVLSAALAAPRTDPGRLSTRAIHEALASEGHTVSIRALTNHRNGVCRCGISRETETD